MQSSLKRGINLLLKLKNIMWFSSSILVLPVLNSSIRFEIKLVTIPIIDEKIKIPKIVMLNLKKFYKNPLFKQRIEKVF